MQVAAADTVVILGDIVDRGPGSRQVIERLLDMRSRCNLVYILGNHEELMLDVLVDGNLLSEWLDVGGLETVESYQGDPGNIPAEHIEFLASGEDYWVGEHELFVHANLQPGVELALQSAEWLRWTHLTGKERPHPSGKRVVCGHTPQPYGVPKVLPGWVCIDTYAFGGGWLSCLDVGCNELFQANEAGEFRQRTLG